MDIIPSHLTPSHMDYLKAKSADDSGKQKTLAEHTWEVLSRLADQYRIRPHLAKLVGDERFWHRLYWTCFLHDFGKAAEGFQHRLTDTESEQMYRWREGHHRHEVLSLAFINWLFPPGHPDRLPVICAVASHHKDLNYEAPEHIFSKYGAGNRSPDQLDRIQFLIDQIAPEIVDDLWDWLARYSASWREHLGFHAVEDIAPQNKASFGVEAICAALDEASQHIRSYRRTRRDRSNFPLDIHYRGLILTADHAASAGAPEFPDMPFTTHPDIASQPLIDLELRSHQRQAFEVPFGSTLMIAPTGSGKTEAAMLWVQRQIKYQSAARLFYVLPYQASMNAMAVRLLRDYFSQGEDEPLTLTSDDNYFVTIQHSRALLKFYQEMMDADSDPRAVKDAAKRLKDLVRLNYFPIQVFSPYQMLKAAYSLKGYEPLLVDYANALFIFDEIHAYDAKRMALIISMIGWLAQYWNARFLVMTATLPPMVKTKLLDALPGSTEILADDALFAASKRHIVYVQDGDLRSQITDHVRRDIFPEQRSEKPKNVLVCCNRIADAQAVYRDLKDKLELVPGENIMLLHGRFNGEDREEKESILSKAVGVKSEEREGWRPFVLVATQVVEVSLDVDFDIIYTDPAPLEALLQRFGRVNRGRGDAGLLCPAVVFREPYNDKPDKPPSYKPYDEEIVRQSILVLEKYCQNQSVEESQVNEMLKEIYTQPIIAEQWHKDYDQATLKFVRDILGTMTPYQSAPDHIRESFYTLFDGRQVLPTDCWDDYNEAMQEGGFLAASKYLVNISQWQYQQCKEKGLIISKELEEKEYVDHINVTYNSETGLDLNTALSAGDEDE